MRSHYTDHGIRDQRWVFLADRITETYTKKAVKRSGYPSDMASLGICRKLVGMVRYIGNGLRALQDVGTTSVFPRMVYPIHISDGCSSFTKQITECMMNNCSYFELFLKGNGKKVKGNQVRNFYLGLKTPLKPITNQKRGGTRSMNNPIDSSWHHD